MQYNYELVILDCLLSKTLQEWTIVSCFALKLLLNYWPVSCRATLCRIVFQKKYPVSRTEQTNSSSAGKRYSANMYRQQNFSSPKGLGAKTSISKCLMTVLKTKKNYFDENNFYRTMFLLEINLQNKSLPIGH